MLNPSTPSCPALERQLGAEAAWKLTESRICWVEVKAVPQVFALFWPQAKIAPFWVKARQWFLQGKETSTLWHMLWPETTQLFSQNLQGRLFFCLSVGCEGVYKPPVPLHLLACCLYISVLSVLMHLQIAKHLLQHGFEPQAICTMISCLINSKVGLSRANQTKSHENCLRFLSFMLNTCSDWAGQQHLVLWHWSQWVGATCSLCYTKTPAVTCLSAANTSKLAEVIVRSPAIFDSSRLSSLACNQSFKKFKTIGDMFRIKILEVDATPQRSSLSSK